MRAAVVGHVEWMEFVPVEHVPAAGEIVHATETWEEAAGGGSVAAVQLAEARRRSRLLYRARRRRDRPRREESARGARDRRPRFVSSKPPSAAASPTSTRGASGRSRPSARGSSPAGTTTHCRGTSSRSATRCYFCAGDADALRRARRAKALVATARVLSTLARGAVELDALVGSGKDEAERYRAGRPRPRAPSRRHDIGRARRLGPARRPVRRRPDSEPGGRRLRRRRLLRRRPRICARRRSRDARCARVRGPLRCGSARRARRPRRGGSAFALTIISIPLYSVIEI